MPFPLKLHTVLYYARKNNLEDIVSWLDHGRAFRISKTIEFESKIMSKFFSMSKITSFNRQLNLYGFRRLSRGSDEGAYYHEFFLRGKHYLTINIVRTRVKGTKIRAASSPDDEPDFDSMPYVNADGIERSKDKSKSRNEEAFEPRPRRKMKKDSPKQVKNDNEARVDVDKTKISNFERVESKPSQISDEALNSARLAVDESEKHAIFNSVQRLENTSRQHRNFHHRNNQSVIRQSTQYQTQREAPTEYQNQRKSYQQGIFPYQNRMQQEKNHPAVQFQNPRKAHQQRGHVYQNEIQRDIDIANTMMNLKKSTNSNMMRMSETHHQRQFNATFPTNNIPFNQRNLYQQNIRANDGFAIISNSPRYNNEQNECNKLPPTENRSPGVSATKTNKNLLKSIETILKGNSKIKYVTLHYDEDSDKNGNPDPPQRNLKEVSRFQADRQLLDDSRNIIPTNGTHQLAKETLKEMHHIQAGRQLGLDDSHNIVRPNGTNVQFLNNDNRNNGANIEYSNNGNRSYGTSSNDNRIYGRPSNDIRNYRASNNDNRNYGVSASSERIHDVAQNASHRSNLYQNFKRSTADECHNMNTGKQLTNQNPAIREFNAAVDDLRIHSSQREQLDEYLHLFNNNATYPGVPKNNQHQEILGSGPKMKMRGLISSLDRSEEPSKNVTNHNDPKENMSTPPSYTHVEEDRTSQVIPNDGDEDRTSQVIPNDGDEERMSQIIPNDRDDSDSEHSEYSDHRGEGDHIEPEEKNSESFHPSSLKSKKKKMQRQRQRIHRKGGKYAENSSQVSQYAPAGSFSDRVGSSKIYLSSENSLSLSEC